MRQYIVKLSIEDLNGDVQYEAKFTKDFLDDFKLRNINPLDEIYNMMRDLIKSQEEIIKRP
jgi:hypothetical protein